MSRLPILPERLLRWALGDRQAAGAIVGDLREEYGLRNPGPARAFAYWLACLSVAIRYAPSRLGDAMWLDVRHSMRALRRAPTFTLATMVALAIGIGAAATLTTIAYGALVRPLPFGDSSRLVRWGQTPIGGSGAINSTSTANFIDLSNNSTEDIELAAHTLRQTTVVATGFSERVLAGTVTAHFFDVLSIQPVIGRGFTAEDDLPGSQPTLMLSHEFWERAFQGTPDVIGQTIRLNNTEYLVIGVLPEGLTWPGNPRVWMTFRWSAEDRQVRNRRAIEPIGRLARDLSLDAATAILQSRFAELARTFPEHNSKSTLAVMPLSDWLLGRHGPNSALIPALAAVAAALLFVAYLNVATLAIGRAEAQCHERVLRSVLGASGWRHWSRRFIEGILLAGPGGLGGALLALWAIPLVIARFGASIPRAVTITPDASTMLVVVAATVIGAAIIAGSGGRQSAITLVGLNHRTTTAALRLRRQLVAIQIGLASGLVYAALLLGGTLASLVRVDLGVPLDNALTFTLGANPGRYTTPVQVRRFFSDVEDQIRALPGVLAVGATTRMPLSGGTNGAVSAADDPARSEPLAEWRAVTPEFFAAMGLTVSRGVDFRSVAPTAERAVVLSEALAASLFPGASAVGRAVMVGDDASYEVVGVVGDLRDFGPTRPSRPTVYLRHGSEAGFASLTDMNIVLRSTGHPLALVSTIRERLRDYDAEATVQNVETLEALAVKALGTSRTTATTVIVTVAGLALLLGLIGVFGVVAVGVEQRTREIGVRLAIGDTPQGIMRLILADGLRMSVAGLALGTLCAWFVHRLIASFLVQSVGPGQPVSAALAIALLMVGTLVACAVPAHRAARLSPTEALRAD